MSRKRGKSLSAEERALWNSVARTVEPLGNAPAEDGLEEQTSAQPEARMKIRERPQQKSAGEQIAGKRISSSTQAAPQPSIDRRARRRLAKGRMAIDSRLDLHGLDQVRAFDRLRGHLTAASTRGERCVLVITGKGGRRFDRRGEMPRSWRADMATSSGVLKRMVPLWLESPELAPLVHAYASAEVQHGGEGALYVLLRRMP